MVNRIAPVVALLVASGTGSPSVTAQPVPDPFLEAPYLLAMAFAAERLDARLSALLSTEDLAPELVERIERGIAGDLRLFAGSLAEREPTLLLRLEEELERSVATARRETGLSLEEVVSAARSRLQEARGALSSPEVRQPPGFLGGVTALLLLAEGGVADGFEAAAEGDAVSYAVGHAALVRSEELWGEIRPRAPEDARLEIDDMFEVLHALYASAVPPTIHSGDPEDAEGPAHRIVGFLEQATGTLLYPNRDSGRLARVLRDLSLGACEAFEEGRGRVGMERIGAVHFYYGGYLPRTLDLLAPSLHEDVGARFSRLLEEEVGWEEAVPICRELTDLLAEARSVLGG